MTVFLGLIVLLAGALGYRVWSRRQRRADLLVSTLPAPRRAMVDRQVPLIRKVPAELQGKLEGKISLFLEQVEFIGCNGLEVTDEMRLSIAAQACLLVVNLDTWYDSLRTVLVYPGAFKSRQAQRHGFVVTERETVRGGESWVRGPVVLSWTHVRSGAANDHDGHNVVFHEFAHQIDGLSGYTDGVPNLGHGQSFTAWAKAFTEAYERHVGHVERGQRTVIDAYGAEGPEEFFAVAVEAFFERPEAFRHAEPEVYAQLSQFFRLDPSTWA